MAARPKRNRRIPERLKDAASVGDIAEAIVSPKRRAESEKGEGKQREEKKANRGKPPLADVPPTLPSPDAENQGETFLVDRVLDVNEEKDEALVSFKGWDSTHNEWLPYCHLSEKARHEVAFLMLLRGKNQEKAHLFYNAGDIISDSEESDNEGEPAEDALTLAPDIGDQEKAMQCLASGKAWCERHLDACPPRILTPFQRDFLLAFRKSMASAGLTFDKSGPRGVQFSLRILPNELEELPAAVARQAGKQELKGEAFDDWFGGSWWRIVSRPDKNFSAYLHAQMGVTITLCCESVYADSHHACERCTWGVALGLDDTSEDTLTESVKNDPKFALAFMPHNFLGPRPAEVCNSIAGSCGFSMSLHFESTRDVKENRKLFRSLLCGAIRRKLEAA